MFQIDEFDVMSGALDRELCLSCACAEDEILELFPLHHGHTHGFCPISLLFLL